MFIWWFRVGGNSTAGNESDIVKIISVWWFSRCVIIWSLFHIGSDFFKNHFLVLSSSPFQHAKWHLWKKILLITSGKTTAWYFLTCHVYQLPLTPHSCVHHASEHVVQACKAAAQPMRMSLIADFQTNCKWFIWFN